MTTIDTGSHTPAQVEHCTTCKSIAVRRAEENGTTYEAEIRALQVLFGSKP